MEEEIGDELVEEVIPSTETVINMLLHLRQARNTIYFSSFYSLCHDCTANTV